MAKSLVDKIVDVQIARWDKELYEQAKYTFEHYEEQEFENKMTFEEYLSKLIANEINVRLPHTENRRI